MTTLLIVAYILGFITVFAIRDTIDDDDYIVMYVLIWIFSPITVPIITLGYTTNKFYTKFIRKLFIKGTNVK